MSHLNRTYKWPYREPDRDYPTDWDFRGEGRLSYFGNMSIPGRHYTYRPFSQGEPTHHHNSYDDFGLSATGMPPPGARNIRSFTLPHRRGGKDQEPIYIIPPKKKPQYVTMEVIERDPEPIMIMPPPPPKQRVVEYELPVKQKPPEPILVPVLPPPKEPEYITVRQIVEEPQGDHPMAPVPVPRKGPTITHLPEESYTNVKYEDTLLGVPRTILWELVLASFVLFIIMLLIAIFIAGFLS